MKGQPPLMLSSTVLPISKAIMDDGQLDELSRGLDLKCDS